jgi:hypothetical protein
MDDLERQKVLKVVSEHQGLDLLVQWRVPYARILGHLRRLIDDGHLVRDDGGLTITDAGRVFLERDLVAARQRSFDVLDLARARQSPADPRVARLPQPDVEQESASALAPRGSRHGDGESPS